MHARITQDDVIYFIVTDRFFGVNKQYADPSDKLIHGGTLDGILSKLDYLLHLGITAIWITPVYKNINRFFDAEPYHYYWAEDFDTIDERLLDGTMLPAETIKSTLAAFIDRCGQKGIKVILDMVVNHAGYGAESHFDPAWFNHGTDGDIKKPLDGLPDFNHDVPAVLDYFIRNMRSWITEGGVTNIRMDTVKHVEPKFWHYFKSQLRGEYAETFLLGEVLNQGKQDVPHLLEYQNFHDFDSLFDFPLATAIRQTLIFDESIPYWLARPRLSESEEPGVLDNDNPLKGGYRNANRLVTVLDNHDLDKRIFSHARTKHTGNGLGLQWAIRVTKLCIGLLMTVRGIPQLYYGTELGLEGWKTEAGDHDMRRDFPWHWIGENQEPVTEQVAAAELYQWTRSLIQLRKQNAAFRYGTTITLWSDTFVYAFLRISVDDVALVVLNNGYEDMQVPISLYLNPSIIPPVAITRIKQKLRHWQTGAGLAIDDNFAVVQVDAKRIEIYCAAI